MSHSISVFIFPGFRLLDMSGPVDVFDMANDAYHKKIESSEDYYNIQICAFQKGSILSSAGVAIEATASLSEAINTDTFIICGAPIDKVSYEPQVVDLLKKACESSKRIVSICSGAFLLAQTGLLDNHKATTHWRYLDLFRAKFPAINLQGDAIFVCDKGIYTSAGITSGIDCCLELVRKDLGHALSSSVSRRLVVYLKRPGDQRQFSQLLLAQEKETKFDELVDWINKNLDKSLSVTVLAERVAMSERNFCRTFSNEFGISPAKFIKKIRAENARLLLTTTNLSLVRIADSCGFKSVDSLRRCFQDEFHTSPSEYFKRFGSVSPSK